MYLQRRHLSYEIFGLSSSLFISHHLWDDFLLRHGMFLSRLLSWCIQRVASLGIVALMCLILVAFVWDHPSQEMYDDGKLRRQITNGQLVYVYYTLFVHILGVLFPLRLCWATRSMTRNLKMVAIQQQASLFRASSKSRRKSEVGYEDSCASDSSDSIALSTLNESDWDEMPLVHAIILPNYKEELDTLRETLDVLACHPQASSSYEVSLHQPSSWGVGCGLANLRLIFFFADISCHGARRIWLQG